MPTVHASSTGKSASNLPELTTLEGDAASRIDIDERAAPLTVAYFPIVAARFERCKDEEDTEDRLYTGRPKIMAESRKSDSLRLASISSIPPRIVRYSILP